MPSKIQRYGWIPDLPDQRDHLFSAPIMTPQQLPPKVDLTAQCPPVYDQGQLGSCTANAIGAAVQFAEMKENLPNVFQPSRLFIYYNERSMEATVNSDSGAQIRDGIKSVAAQGDCSESDWAYDIGKFSENRQTAAIRRPNSTLSRVTSASSQPYPNEGVFGGRLPICVRLYRVRKLRESASRPNWRRADARRGRTGFGRPRCHGGRL